MGIFPRILLFVTARARAQKQRACKQQKNYFSAIFHASKKRSISQTQLSRVWFLNQGCKQVPLDYTRGIVRWAHPDGYFLNAQGQKIAHCYNPSRINRMKNPNCKMGKGYPFLSETGGKDCHVLMALAFHGSRTMFNDKWEMTNDQCQMAHVGICHHLIPDPLDYRPANLLCWLTRAEHMEADRRLRALKKVVPDGDLRLFSYERLRELQDPRTMSREQFELELAALAQQHFHRDNLSFDARMSREMSHHQEH